MKKLTIYGCMGAIALCSIGGLTACSSDIADSSNDTNKNTGERSVVKTQFAINLPHGASETSTSNAKTRMTDTNTQNKKDGSGYNNFRGIQDLYLLTFDGEPNKEGHTAATKIIPIGSGNNAYDKDHYRSLYRDIEIPTGTSHFIMNGRAIRETGSTNFTIGVLQPSDTQGQKTNLSELNYSLVQITAKTFGNDDNAKEIINQLNKVAGTSVTWEEGEDQSKVTKTLKWSELSSKTEEDLPSWMTMQECKFLAERYSRFISLTAGSTNTVKATLNNLKEVLVGETSGSTTSTTTVPESKKLTKAIYDACTTAVTAIEAKSEFPADLNLPDGVAKVEWYTTATTPAFAYVSNDAVKLGENKIDYSKISYPAEISYTVNTKAMVSDNGISEVSALPAYTDWLKSDWTKVSSFSEGAVTTSTKTVALKNPVQYSVACLQTTVKCSNSTLKDNAAEITKNYGEGKLADQDITIPSDGYILTGILVGGQPAKVDWAFNPTSEEKFEHTIYDKDMNGTDSQIKVTTNDGTPNYTLVLDNKSLEESLSDVYVTLELVNKGGSSFYGADGLIPQNGKFYLIGKLALENKTTQDIDHVFLQDYTTKANFTITSLKKAYNCIPDLRAAGVNVGLAVDLEWKEGITFDVDL